ncbi:MAG: ribose 5-phosphate isomerase B [Acidobacteriota bacterium]|nr:ribose 5-phosphate isomerase B [Acidobacteriota bacterium]
MRVAIGFDHAGFPLKADVIRVLGDLGHEAVDFGTDSTAPVDYPDFAKAVGLAVSRRGCDRGIIVCGSGVGASVAATKIPGVRAALCHDTFSARQGVEDDDLNVLCLGARVIGPSLAAEVMRAFLAARFSNLERHVRRLNKVKQIETDALSGAWNQEEVP